MTHEKQYYDFHGMTPMICSFAHALTDEVGNDTIDNGWRAGDYGKLQEK